jgi:subtilisin family serine protease
MMSVDINVNAPSAWATSRGTGVKVAVVDTGIDTTHPDLAANIKGGVSFVTRVSSYKDDNGHGTHVAGIIAAINNTIGVVGVAPNAQLYSVKVLDRTGSGTVSSVIAGIDWSAKNGMQVISMSLGTNTDFQSLHDAVDRAYLQGVVVVAAAGNDYGGPISYPAAYDNVIAVTATDSNNKIASFSNI